MNKHNICTFLCVSNTPLMTVMSPVEHLDRRRLQGVFPKSTHVGRILMQLWVLEHPRPSGKQSVLCLRPDALPRRERGSGALKTRSKEIQKEKANREGETFERFHLNHLITAGKHMAKPRFDRPFSAHPSLHERNWEQIDQYSRNDTIMSQKTLCW